MAYTRKPSKPPFHIERSRVWHACCPLCYVERGGRKGKTPQNHINDKALCCFCRKHFTGFRIRLAGQAAVPCRHVNYRPKGA